MNGCIKSCKMVNPTKVGGRSLGRMRINMKKRGWIAYVLCTSPVGNVADQGGLRIGRKKTAPNTRAVKVAKKMPDRRFLKWQFSLRSTTK
jgi:hypothetical protein